MMKKKVLFLIHDLGVGGAEKVLVNLVNNLNPEKYELTVMTILGGGCNEQFLKPHVRLKHIFPCSFPGNTHLLKLLTPRQLHRLFIHERYDVEISYLEGPSARIVSGCPEPDTKLVSWIHIEQQSQQTAAQAFRNYKESRDCYGRFHRTICVSEGVKEDFQSLYPDISPIEVLYNVNETEMIISQALEAVHAGLFSAEEFKICVVGKVATNKGLWRMLEIHRHLRQVGFPLHVYWLGTGVEQERAERQVCDDGLSGTFTFLGYQLNPYKYMAACDLFVCASFAEGFSTATTEALVLGLPVLTVRVSGMSEMLGEHNQFGIIADNTDTALEQGLRHFLEHPEVLAHYRQQAQNRGRFFAKEQRIQAIEQLLDTL